MKQQHPGSGKKWDLASRCYEYLFVKEIAARNDNNNLWNLWEWKPANMIIDHGSNQQQIGIYRPQTTILSVSI